MLDKLPLSILVAPSPMPSKNLFIDNMIYNFNTLDYIHKHLNINQKIKIHINNAYYEKFVILLNDVSKNNNSNRLFPLNMNDYMNKITKYDTEYLYFTPIASFKN